MQEIITFPSDGLALSGIVHVPDGREDGERRPAIIMMHGFGANKNGGPEWVCEQFESWGYVALRFDYRGCGDSGGEPGRVIAMEEVSDAQNAVTYMAARPEVDPARIALCGSSLGAAVAVYAAAIDDRVGAVILENGLGNGERMMRSMHSDESWNRFLELMQDGIRHREETGTSKMIHRFDIFEMPKELQVNLTSNNSVMQFTSETAVSFFLHVSPRGNDGPDFTAPGADPAQRPRPGVRLRGSVQPGAPRRAALRAASAGRRRPFHVRRRQSAGRLHAAQLAGALFPGRVTGAGNNCANPS